jgi:hypothetical protein
MRYLCGNTVSAFTSGIVEHIEAMLLVVEVCAAGVSSDSQILFLGTPLGTSTQSTFFVLYLSQNFGWKPYSEKDTTRKTQS